LVCVLFSVTVLFESSSVFWPAHLCVQGLRGVSRLRISSSLNKHAAEPAQMYHKTFEGIQLIQIFTKICKDIQ
jgi:hypothetical protein